MKAVKVPKRATSASPVGPVLLVDREKEFRVLTDSAELLVRADSWEYEYTETAGPERPTLIGVRFIAEGRTVVRVPIQNLVAAFEVSHAEAV